MTPDLNALDNSTFIYRFGEYLERGLFYDVCDILHFQAKAQIGPVRSIFFHHLGIGKHFKGKELPAVSIDPVDNFIK